MYNFVSGYTAKVAGTEMGVSEPTATFSTCFGAAFMVWHPSKYAELLANKIAQYGTHVWLLNTGWSGGAYGVGSRMSLTHTRSIIDAIHSGELSQANYVTDPNFGFAVPTACSAVPSQMLQPKLTWADPVAYETTARKLAKLFHKNFQQFEDKSAPAIANAGPWVGK